MTVIKASTATALDRFRPLPPLVALRIEPEPPDPRLIQLADEVARLEAALAATQREAVLAVAAAREEGASEVLLDEGERLAALENGVAAALAAWRDRLAGTEALAAALAQAALGRMFDDHADLTMLVERTIATHVARIGADAVVGMRVSALDFPDRAALDALCRRAELPLGTVTGHVTLRPGECRVELRLGQADLDLGAQRGEIERVLSVMAGADPA